MYDTYGFPLELIQFIAKEKGYSVDDAAFANHMLKQQEQSGKKTTDELATVTLDASITTEFTGYHELETSAKIIALIHNNELVKQVPPESTCWVITQKSPFFIVGGGQVPDQGWLRIGKQEAPLLQVRYINNAIGAEITTPTALKIGDEITSIVDPQWRTNAMKNHTATHLLQSALIQLFGKTIKQSGSLVHPDYLRFDFTYHENLSQAQIKAVEDIVNQKIRENIPLTIHIHLIIRST